MNQFNQLSNTSKWALLSTSLALAACGGGGGGDSVESSILQSLASVSNSGEMQLDGARALETFTIDGTQYLVAAGSRSGGISVFSIGADGNITNVLNQNGEEDGQFAGASGILAQTSAASTNDAFIYVAANAADNGDNAAGAIRSFAVTTANGSLEVGKNSGASGVLSAVNGQELSGNTLNLQNVGALAAIPDTNQLLSSNYHEQRLGIYALGNQDDDDSRDALTERLAETSDASVLGGTGPVFGMTSVQIGGSNLVYAVSFDDDAIGSFTIENGEMTEAETVADTAPDEPADGSEPVDNDTFLQLEGAFAVTTGNVGGTTYVFAAGYIDAGISVFRTDGNGNLTSVANTLNNDSVELDGVVALEFAAVNGTNYLFAGSFLDDGVSVYRVGNDGSLTHDSRIRDNGDLLLSGVSDIEVVDVNGTSFLYASSYAEDGVQAFTISP